MTGGDPQSEGRGAVYFFTWMLVPGAFSLWEFTRLHAPLGSLQQSV